MKLPHRSVPLKFKSPISMLSIISLMGLPAKSLTVEEFRTELSQKNRQVQSFDRSLEASRFKRDGGDIVLATNLFAQASYTDDRKPPVIALLGTRTETEAFTLGLNKKFSTGTTAQVSSTLAKVETEGSPFSNPNPVQGGIGFKITQSLWKDFFGRSTELRRERESSQYSLEALSVEMQKQSFLASAEGSYWDLWYLQEEREVRKNSIERARRLETWTSRRLSNGIGDRADLLQAQTLVSSRDLKSLMTEDNWKAAQQRLASLLEREQSEIKVQVQESNVVPLEAFVQNGQAGGASQNGEGDTIISLEAMVAIHQSRFKQTVSAETYEGLKPDLSLEGAYSTNSQADTYNVAMQDATRTNLPTTSVALKFSMPLGGSTKSAVRSAASADYESTKVLAQKKFLDSQVQWTELKRRHEELIKKLAIAEKLAKLQVEKLNREQTRLSQGRTTTAQVITFEEEAAEAQLSLLQLKAEQKKLENQARLFTKARRDLL